MWFSLGLICGWSQPIGDFLITSGVIGRDPSGRPQAYLIWSAPDPTRLRGRMFSVYQKEGGPDAAGPYVRKAIVGGVATEATVEAALSQGQLLAPELPPPTQLVELLLTSAGYPRPTGPVAGALTLVNEARVHEAIRTNLEAVLGAHPALALSAGRAWTGAVGEGLSTFELREWDPIVGRDARPVGRVTLNSVSPSILPAPGAPNQTSDLSPSGNLVIRLRWAVPPELRRRSPVQLGFNIWRMPRAEAQALGFFERPPSLSELRSKAVRINSLPVFVAADLKSSDASDVVADRNLAWFADDNGRSEVGGRPFEDGAEFAYFVTARDLLGKDGISSGAGIGAACNTLPPAPPKGLSVSSMLHAPSAQTVRPALQISWERVSNADRYELYRSTEPASLESGVPLPSATPIAILSVDGAGGALSWTDDLLASGPVKRGAAFFYSVRSVRLTACGPVVSALTPPARTAWRDFTPPPAPRGNVDVNCPQPVVRYELTTQSPLDAHDPAALTNVDGVVLRRHQAIVRRRDRGIVWARVFVSDSLGVVFVSPPIWFAADEDVLRIPFTRPLAPSAGLFVNLTCEVGNAAGRVATVSHAERASEEIVGTQFLAAQISPVDLNPSDLLYGAMLESVSAGGVANCLGMQVVGSPGPDGTVSLLRDRATPARYFVVDRSGNSARNIGVFSAGSTTVGAAPILVIRDPQLLGWKPGQPLPNYCAYALTESGNQTPEFGPCIHESHPEGSGRIVGPQLRAEFDGRAAEYRLYRRIDNGPLTLIGQGPLTPDPANPGQTYPILREDQSTPEAGGVVCYFAQAVDADGNGSVLSPLGCVTIAGGALPTPVLARPEPEGDLAHARMRLNWTCPTPGVARFEVFLQAEKGPKGGESGGGTGALSVVKVTSDPPVAIHRTRDPFGKLVQVSAPKDRMISDPIGSSALGEGPQFSLSAPVEVGVPYMVFIRALGPGPLFAAKRGEASFSYRFTWTRPAGGGDGDVPWPQRPTPPVTAFHPDIVAFQAPAHARLWPTNADEAPVGVRIGRLRVLDRDITDRSLPAGQFYPLATIPRTLSLAVVDPNLGVFPELVAIAPRTNAWVLPAVLYRQQVPNSAYPAVSGDLVQVSPLVGSIAWEIQAVGNDLQVAWLKDPFIFVSRHMVRGDVALGPPDLWLKDTHPVLEGARYRYWLVRFQKSGEPDVIIPAGEVEIQ